MPNLSELSIAELEAEIARRKQARTTEFKLPERLSHIVGQNKDLHQDDNIRWEARAFEDVEQSLENNLKFFIDERIDEDTLKNEFFVSAMHTVYGEAGLHFLDKLRKRYNLSL